MKNLLFLFLLLSSCSIFKPTEDKIYSSSELEEAAKFKENNRELFNFVFDKCSNFRYQKEETIPEKVVLEFIVEKNGKISHIKVKKTSGVPKFDKEIIRIIKMTNGIWTPAKVKGEKVRSQFLFPLLLHWER
jgi:TonB family protein